MTGSEREIVEGRDIEPWPSLKLSRAYEHFALLNARVGQWNASRLFKGKVRVTEDRTLVQLLQVDGPRPPVSEWGLAFCDGVHNLRAALDCLAWEIAHLDDRYPTNPRRVFFPVVTERDNWARAARNLESIPDDILARIEKIQPYNNEGGWNPNSLVLLNELDNADKHRQVLSAVAGPGSSR